MKNSRLKYFVSLTNGNTAERPLNDNDNISVVGRAEFIHRSSRKVRMKIGGGAYLNEITEGELPDLIAEERIGYTADFALKLYALRLRGQWIAKSLPLLMCLRANAGSRRLSHDCWI